MTRATGTPGRASKRAAAASAASLRELIVGVAITSRVLAAWLVGMTVPEPVWRPLTRTIARVAVWLRPRWRREQLAALDRLLGRGDPAAQVEILTDRIAFGHESRLYGLREYRPGSREHHVRLEGAEIVRDGLAAGNGVILWVARFVCASLVTKIALQEAGFIVSHLSRPTHGFSPSRIGVRWLNPIWTRIEERYVRERIVMAPGHRTAALRTLHARLAEGQIVSISVGDEGIHTVTVPFFGGELCLATGPITLAASIGAPLIPVFTVRTGAGAFRVELQSPLKVPLEEDRNRRFTRVAEQYARRLAPFVREYPGQWLG